LSTGEKSAVYDCLTVAVQDVLKRLRLIDDRVINALNSSLPTESFKEKKNSEEQCKEFCDQVCFYLWYWFVAFCCFLSCCKYLFILEVFWKFWASLFITYS